MRRKDTNIFPSMLSWAQMCCIHPDTILTLLVGEASRSKEQVGNVPNQVYTDKVHKMPSRMFRGGALLLEEASTSRGPEQAVETLRMEEDKKGEVKIQGFPLLLHQRHPNGEAMTVHIALLFNCSGQGSS